jgi:predicted chitinase
MTFLLTITHETRLKTQPIDSRQLPANQILKAAIGEKFAPIGWELAENQHVKFAISDKAFLYAFAQHISLTQDGVDVLAPKFLVTQSQADYIFERSTDAFILADLNNCLIKFGITDKEDIRQFLAQCAHESGGLQYLEELATGDDYEWRSDLGNTEEGDGRKFKGGGLIQLTGRANYQDFAKFMGDPEIVDQGVNYVADKYPVSSAGFWWRNNEMSQYIANGATVEQVSTRVNGANPANGLDDRIYYYNRAKDVIL